MNDIQVWGYNVPCDCLNQMEVEYLTRLPQVLPGVEWVWGEMDRVWEIFNLDNKRSLGRQPIDDYYAHPVWLMNGIFTALDPVSRSHRSAIACFLKHAEVKSIADYGGGFGTLALAITNAMPDVSVSMVEPYPSSVAQRHLNSKARIKFVDELETGGYDAIVAQDVLEHVEDPVGLAYKIADATREGGKVVIANCFYPVIKCHLPSTFHLRHTFSWVMMALGLRYLGTVDGAAHAQIYERAGGLDITKARCAESFSRLIGPVLNKAKYLQARLKHKVQK